MRDEYVAILDAGSTCNSTTRRWLSWDQINPEPALPDYRAYIAKRIEDTHYALRGLPRERIRMHVCWGSWHGPRTNDFPFADIVDEVLKGARRATARLWG